MGILSSLTGSSQAKAAKRAAKALEQANQQNIGQFNRSFDAGADLLQPRIDGETIAANRLLDVISGNGSVRDDAVFAQDLDESISSVNKQFSPTGKSLSGQRLLALRDADFGAEDRALNRLLTFASPTNTNNLINLRGSRDANIANARVGAASAFGAGQIGAANARAAGLGNIIDLGSTLSSAGAFSKLSDGIGGLFKGKPKPNESIGTIDNGQRFSNFA
ncbi:hypothetical protein [uncultured Paraglaciecola sp.]|uniref:hypothetical protein n=1 Tax=uncultured Paraglaciecola sp. TaxID=1765024 RepID=UPI0026359052|nr:hypothetical protein [uncultured Paraglaciecola sp.]